MKFYLLVMIALLGVSGCTKTGTESNGDVKTSTSPQESTSPAEGNETATVNATPKDALTAFVAAIKAKDETALKNALSEKTNKMFELQSKKAGKSILEFFDPKELEGMKGAPETRNEKITGDKATLEAKDPDSDKWDEMPFVKENGSWKVAIADEDFDKNYEAMSKEAVAAGKDSNVKAPEGNANTAPVNKKTGN